MIVLGPGSLYTSIMPNLVTDGIAEAVARSDALRIYVLNIMTQDGETEGYSAGDHIEALFSNSGEHLFDWCLANSREIPAELAERSTSSAWAFCARRWPAGRAAMSGTIRTPSRASSCAYTAPSRTRGSTARRVEHVLLL